MNTEQQVLCDRVRGGMVRKQMSQADLARATGVSQKHLSQMLTGRAQGSLAMWDKLLEALK